MSVERARPTRIVCPRCRKAMARVRRGDARFFRCEPCGAHALTDAMLRRIVPGDVWTAIWPAIRAAAAPGGRRCPSCGGCMDLSPPLAKAGGIRVDMCDRRRLLYLDPDELDRLPKVPVVEEVPPPPELLRAIADAQVALLKAEYEEREAMVFTPFRAFGEVILAAVLRLMR